MKSKLVIVLCVLALGFSSVSASADSQGEGSLMIIDVAITRPACLAATVIGSAFFVISLPISLTSRSVHRSADALVTRPAKATFTRPLGDYHNLKD